MFGLFQMNEMNPQAMKGGYVPQGYFQPGMAPPPQQNAAPYAQQQPQQQQPQSFQLPQLSQAECDDIVRGLKDAMKGLGTNDDKLMDLLTKYPPIYTEQIALAYKNTYKTQLIDDVKSETSGDYQKLACALCVPIFEYEAQLVHDSIAGLGTKDEKLMEVLIGRSNFGMKKLIEAYDKLYGKDMESEVRGDVGGTLGKFYSTLMLCNKDENNEIKNVESDCDALYKAGEKKIGTDESTFINILCSRSDAHLRQVFDLYEKKYNRTFEKVIKNEFSGVAEKGLLKYVASVRSKPEYFSSQLEDSMKGLGTNDSKLIRLVVRFRDINDITPIKEAFRSLYKITLKDRISDETSGDYRKLLIKCIHE